MNARILIPASLCLAVGFLIGRITCPEPSVRAKPNLTPGPSSSTPAQPDPELQILRTELQEAQGRTALQRKEIAEQDLRRLRLEADLVATRQNPASSHAEAPDHRYKLDLATHVSLKAYPNEVIFIQDEKTGTLFQVKENGREIQAISKEGTLLWETEVIAKAGNPAAGSPVLRHLRINDESVHVVCGQSLVILDRKTGAVIDRAPVNGNS